MKTSTLFELALTAGLFLLNKTSAANAPTLLTHPDPVPMDGQIMSTGSDLLSNVLSQANVGTAAPVSSSNPITAPMVTAIQAAAVQSAAQNLTYQQQSQIVNAANVASGMQAGMALRATAEAAARMAAAAPAPQAAK